MRRQERHRGHGHLRQLLRDQARRARAGGRFRRQPHAGSRSHGAARARRVYPFSAAAGAYVIRKTKREVIDLIVAWAALEGMAARLVTQTAGDREIAALRRMFATFEDGQVRAHLDEYSEINIEFHQALIRMSGNTTLVDLAENLFTHMRMIRRKTIGERDRADRSIRDHMQIIEALERRDAARAEILVRDHALGLAEHIAKYVNYLD